MESIKFHEAAKIAAMDAHLVSTDENYSRDNAYTYYITCNVWCALAYDLCPKAKDILADQLENQGLIPTIKILSADADIIMHSDSVEISGISDLSLALVSELSVSDALQLLRFAKRFTPDKANLLRENTLSSFKGLLNEVKMRQRLPYSHFIISEIRDIISCVCLGFSDEDLVVDGFFSSGSVAYSDSCRMRKFEQWDYPYFLDITYPVNDCPFPQEYEYQRLYDPLAPWTEKPIPHRRVAEVVAVPKNYKSFRIIAKENSTRQWFLQAIRTRLERCIQYNGFSEYIPLEAQHHNQLCCFNGSMSDSYSTIDLSSASDRISVSIFREVFPEKVVDAVSQYRSSYIDIDGKIYTSQMVSTSGSAVCFVVEAILFYAIAQCATNIVERFTGNSLLPPAAYGDDIIIDNAAYETCVDILAILGFKVNLDKSFTSPSLYRESCGVEFINGVETTSVYYPRQIIKDSVKSAESLISMHNRLYKFWDVHVFLKKCLRRLLGNQLTTSTVDDYICDNITDILDPVRTNVPVTPPYDGENESAPIYEGHMCIDQRPIGRPSKVYDMYYYVMYLIYGPMYTDPLLELLGVSESRISNNDRYAKFAPIVDIKPRF